VAVRLRRHAWAALPVGLLFALVVGIKATGLVALPFAVLALAGDRGWRPIARSAGLALTGLAGGYAMLWAITGYGLGWLPALSGTADLVQWTSPPTAVGMTVGYALRAVGLAGASPAVLAVVRVVALVVLAAVLLGLWGWARGGLPTGPHPASSGARDARRVVLAAGYALAAVTLLGPVAFPWYALVPLAVLGYARPDEPARRRLAWFAAGCALLVLPDGTGLAALTKLPGALLMTLAVIVLTVRASAAFRRRRLPAAADPAIPTPTTR
jgi:alpha-1,6-mannosyltransferase